MKATSINENEKVNKNKKFITNVLIKNISKPYEEDYCYFPKNEMIKIKQNNYNYFNNTFAKDHDDSSQQDINNTLLNIKNHEDIRDINPTTGYLKENGHLINKQHFDNDYTSKDFYDIVAGDKIKSQDKLNKRMNRIRTEYDYPSVWNYHDIFTNKSIIDKKMNLISNLDPHLAFREDPFKNNLSEKLKKLNEVKDNDIKELSITLPIKVNKPMAPIKTFKFDGDIQMNSYSKEDREHEYMKNLGKMNIDYIKINYKNVL